MNLSSVPEVKFNNCFNEGSTSYKGEQLFNIEKIIMDELNKIESKGEVKFTSYVSKLVSSVWNKYFSFCMDILSLGKMFRSKDFKKIVALNVCYSSV